jgi:DNA-binding SARP family transcriptional activator
LLGSAVAEIRALEYGAFFWPLPEVAARLCAHALALDIEPDYMRSIVRHRKLAPPRHAPAAWPWAVMIRALGRFDIEVAGVPLRGAGSKAQAKPLTMLACLVALGGNAVPIATITQMLWRGEGREGAKSAFAVTLHRLRQLLGNTQWLTVDNGRVTLDPDHVWIDHRALRIALDAMDVATPTDRTSADLDAMLALYTGPLLADDPSTWARAARDQLRMRVDAIVARYAGALPPVRCRALLSRALAADPGLAMAAKMLAALA